MPGDAGRDVASRPSDDASGIELAHEDEQQLRALEELDPRAWTVMTDLRWPGRSFPNIDFVAIGPGGVFVVDSVAEAGYARVRDDRLRIDDRPQDGRVLATATAARTIAEWLPTEYRGRVHPIVCLSRRERFNGTSRGVTVCSTPTLKATVTSPEAWLEPQHVEHVAELIRKRLVSVPEPRTPAEETPPPATAAAAERAPAATVPEQRRRPIEDEPGTERAPVPVPPARPRSRAREIRSLVWLVTAISLVMLGLVLAIGNPTWVDFW